MQRKLTVQESERCAKACGWEFDPLCPGWKEPKDDEGLREYHTSPFRDMLDPYFWFPRLWVRYKELTKNRYNEALFSRPDMSLVEDCLALCAAIEALEGVMARKARKPIKEGKLSVVPASQYNSMCDQVVAAKARIAELERQLHESETQIATTADLLNSWARESQVVEYDYKARLGLRDLADRLWAKWSGRVSEIKAALAGANGIVGALKQECAEWKRGHDEHDCRETLAIEIALLEQERDKYKKYMNELATLHANESLELADAHDLLRELITIRSLPPITDYERDLYEELYWDLRTMYQRHVLLEDNGVPFRQALENYVSKIWKPKIAALLDKEGE